MADHEEWRLGDESPGTDCPVCGKENRAGAVRCASCGSRLGLQPEADPASLRTIGEAMAGGRLRRRHERPWRWPATAVALLAAVGAAYWWSLPSPRHLRLDDVGTSDGSTAAVQPSAVPPPASAPPRAVAAVAAPPTAVRVVPPSPAAVAAPPAPLATVVERAEAPRPTVVAAPPPHVALPAPQPRPTTVRAAAPAPQPPPAARQPAAAEREPRHAAPHDAAPPAPARAELPPTATESAPAAPSPGGEESAAIPTERRSREERPALGTDLVEARRAYRAALDAYNARADAYNAVADEVQRAESGGDPERVARLHVRLESARNAAERARTDAEALRGRMEEVQAQYR
jgi:hypothetical protein